MQLFLALMQIFNHKGYLNCSYVHILFNSFAIERNILFFLSGQMGKYSEDKDFYKWYMYFDVSACMDLKLFVLFCINFSKNTKKN